MINCHNRKCTFTNLSQSLSLFKTLLPTSAFTGWLLSVSSMRMCIQLIVSGNFVVHKTCVMFTIYRFLFFFVVLCGKSSKMQPVHM